MKTNDRIRDAFDRNVRVMERRASVGKTTAVTKVSVDDGLLCTVESGPWSFKVDLDEASGGTDAAPTPGVYGRGALGSCLAMAYILFASKREIPIRDLKVQVEADFDARGMFGFEDAHADYEHVRLRVFIDSPAPREEVEAMMEEAENYSGYLQIFRKPQRVDRIVRFTSND